MKGSELIKMTVNLAGEPLIIDVDFNQQNEVRDAERLVKQYIDKWKKEWPDFSDRKMIAMAAFQFAQWYVRLNKIQTQTIELAKSKCSEIDDALNNSFDFYNSDSNPS